MHSLSPPSPLGRGQNHRTQRNYVMDNYFIICWFGLTTNQFNKGHYYISYFVGTIAVMNVP